MYIPSPIRMTQRSSPAAAAGTDAAAAAAPAAADARLYQVRG